MVRDENVSTFELLMIRPTDAVIIQLVLDRVADRHDVAAITQRGVEPDLVPGGDQGWSSPSSAYSV